MAFNNLYYDMLAFYAHYDENSTHSFPSIFSLMKVTPTDFSQNGTFFIDKNGAYIISSGGFSIGTSINVTRNVDKDGIVTTNGVYTITNHGNADITIAKICLVARVYAATSLSSPDLRVLETTALDVPITISGGGGVGQITYTITSNFATAAT